MSALPLAQTAKTRRTPLDNPALRAILSRVGASALTLLVIIYMALFGLTMAERGINRLPARPLNAAVEALTRTLDYVVRHPATYYWHRQDTPAASLVLSVFSRSAALLLLALGVAAAVGIPAGSLMAVSRRRLASPLVLILSLLGVSVPTFLLGMLFWAINVYVYRFLGLDKALLPQTGFGWDAHMVMPTLVLATRPLAQIVQVTYVTMSDVLKQDYIQVARAKGLPKRLVVNVHALRNVLVPVLTALGASLRFSLASLPVVEYFFYWPGVGLTLLQAIDVQQPLLVVDLLVSLGFLFLLINMILDVIYRLIDPRLRQQEPVAERRQEDELTWQERWEDVKSLVSFFDFRRWISLPFRKRGRAVEPEKPGGECAPTEPTDKALPTTEPVPSPFSALPARARWHTLRSALSNPMLLIGGVLVLAFFGLAFYGEKLAPADPAETHGVMMIEGKVYAPPFKPSPTFPWGSDPVGRDVQALVLTGARQTLSLALAGMLARLLVGACLGVLAGWWQDSWLDRLVTGAIAVWAAFPVTLFTMIVILALGIQQGMSVFVVALCVVGWGEIAQVVRGQVLTLKPQLFIEAARAVGARPSRILNWHILPHLVSPLLALAILEMGGVLMLLAELGYLNIFLGGGFRAELVGTTYFYSDVPEWGALLANIHRWWRSYPWMAWYPGCAFFLAILAFNLWGEGLRRLLDETRINVNRLVNRYTLIVAVIALVGVGWIVRSTQPVEAYDALAQQFDVQRAMQDVRTLASPEFEGREAGMPGGKAAAQYIADQMQAAGLQPAGDKDTYFQRLLSPRFHLTKIPRLEILDSGGRVAETLTYRQDFVEHISWALAYGYAEGPVVGLAFGRDPELPGGDPYRIGGLDLYDKVILVRAANARYVNFQTAAGALIVSEDAGVFQRKYLLPRVDYRGYVPVMIISAQVADRLLAPAGSSLAQLDATAAGLGIGQVAPTGDGALVRLDIDGTADDEEKLTNVIGFIPGSGAQMGEGDGRGLDGRVILVSAYYDGLGVGPDGTLYPGANDNASSVALMLEIARALKQSTYAPQKTVVFAAWCCGERADSLSVSNVMNAKRGFGMLTVEVVIELSGVGAGSGDGIALGEGSSFSMVQLYQDSAAKIGVPITTRGRDPHHGMGAVPAFGGRSALSAYVSWDGSDQDVHTNADTSDKIDLNKLKKVGQTTLLVVSVLGQAEAQESPMQPLTTAEDYIQGARMFDEEQALEHIAYLASDEMDGRRSGTPGGQAASDYIAARFAEYGLQPGGPDDSYFQPFTTPYTTMVAPPSLSVVSPDGQIVHTYALHEDYLPFVTGILGTGQAEGRVVWLNDCAENDFDSPDLAGRIALCVAPSSVSKEAVAKAIGRRVGGLLLVTDDKGPFPHPSYRRGKLVNIPVFLITEAVAETILTGSPYTPRQLALISTTIPLSSVVRMSGAIEPRDITARNVLGWLPGADPEHKDEFVVLGAHYDHMGHDPDDRIYNGANDNASGVAVVLEVARMWQAQGFRPARNVLFAAWDDEEQGLLGSYHYVKNPSHSLTQTVAMLDLDMVGVGEDLHINALGPMAAQLLASAKVYSITTTMEDSFGGSDHVPFWEAGVHAGMLIMYKKDSVFDPSYHRPEDDLPRIQAGALRTVGVLSAHTLAAWSGGGITGRPPSGGPSRNLLDLILPTPTCAPPWPVGAMTCDHGQWSR